MREKMIKMMNMQNFRRLVQGLVLFLLFFSPLSQIFRTYRQDPHPYTQSPVYGNFILNAVVGAVDHTFRDFFKLFYDDITGGPYSIKIYFLHLAEPFTAAVNSIVNLFHPGLWDVYMIFSFLLPLLIALIFGRVYCGYICPMSLIVSFNRKLQAKYFNKKAESTSASPLKLPRWNQFYFYGILAAAFLQPLFLQYMIPPALFQNTINDYILYGGFTLWGLFLLALLAFEIYRPAFFCKNLCPTGLFLNKMGEKRFFQINYVSGNKCQQDCHLCNEICWLGLNPKGHADDPACDLCHRCVAVCPTDRLTLTPRKDIPFRKKKNKAAASSAAVLFAVLLIPLFMPWTELQAQADPDYVNPALFSTLHEGQLKGKSVGQSGEIHLYYSIIASREIQEGDNVYLHLHIQMNEKLFNEGLEIQILLKDEIVKKEIFETANFPISIPKPSVYRIGFPFYRGKSYRVKVLPKNPVFLPVEFSFSYPSGRF